MLHVQSVVCILGKHASVKYQWHLIGGHLLRLSANVRLLSAANLFVAETEGFYVTLIRHELAFVEGESGYDVRSSGF